MTDSRKITYSSYANSLWQRLLIHITEFITGRKALQRIYDQLLDQHLEGTTFWAEALKRLKITVEIDQRQLDAVPKDIPLVVIANHPFGVVDGLAICEQVARIRPHFKIVLNDVLCQDSRIDQHVLPIDFSPTRAAQKENLATRKACIEELAKGGTIIIFPAGGVSTAPTTFGEIQDLDWKPFTAKLLEKSQANVLPLFFHGQNSRLFQFVSQFSETLRIGMLVKEVNNKRGSVLKIEVGQLIPYSDLASLESTEYRIAYLRDKVMHLKNCSNEPNANQLNTK